MTKTLSKLVNYPLKIIFQKTHTVIVGHGRVYRGFIGLVVLALMVYLLFGRLQKISVINSAIITSVVAVLAGFLLDKLVFQSVISVRQAKQNLAERFIYYAFVWGNPGTLTDKRLTDAQESTRNASTLLRSRIHSTPLYFIFWITGLLPNKKNALKACAIAIGVSNGLSNPRYLDKNIQDIKLIEKLINVEIYAEDERPLD